MRQTWATGIVPVHKEPLVDPRLQQVMSSLLEEFPVEKVVDVALAEVRAEVPAFRSIDPSGCARTWPGRWRWPPR